MQAKRGVLRGALPALVLALAGCSNAPDPIDAPVSWWHQLEGGPIADLRPPPPGVSDPFPNLGQIPKRPTPTDLNTRQSIADALSADRTLAERDAALVPLAPAVPAAPPKPAPASASAPSGQPSGAADQGSGITASLDAASAPPPSASAPAKAAPPTPAAPAPTSAASATPASPAPPPAPAQSGPLPEFAARPPAAPNLPGLAIPTQPAPVAIVSGKPPEASPIPTGPNVMPLNFAPGSAIVPTSAIASLRTFAAKRKVGAISITGRGEASSSNPDVQAAALALGLDRARAIAAALTASGTPPTAIRLAAEAAGRGAYLRLVD